MNHRSTRRGFLCAVWIAAVVGASAAPAGTVCDGTVALTPEELATVLSDAGVTLSVADHQLLAQGSFEGATHNGVLYTSTEEAGLFLAGAGFGIPGLTATYVGAFVSAQIEPYSAPFPPDPLGGIVFDPLEDVNILSLDFGTQCRAPDQDCGTCTPFNQTSCADDNDCPKGETCVFDENLPPGDQVCDLSNGFAALVVDVFDTEGARIARHILSGTDPAPGGSQECFFASGASSAVGSFAVCTRDIAASIGHIEVSAPYGFGDFGVDTIGCDDCEACDDLDQDGFYVAAQPGAICPGPADCDDRRTDDDTDGTPDGQPVNPKAEELCDGIDNNCDGQTDEGCDCDEANPFCNEDCSFALCDPDDHSRFVATLSTDLDGNGANELATLLVQPGRHAVVVNDPATGRRLSRFPIDPNIHPLKILSSGFSLVVLGISGDLVSTQHYTVSGDLIDITPFGASTSPRDAVLMVDTYAVLEAARTMGIEQHSEFARTTLRRWLHERPPTEALEAWRALLAPTLSESESRSAGKAERKLLDEARRIAKMDERPMDPGASIDARAGITADEQRVLDELAGELAKLEAGD